MNKTSCMKCRYVHVSDYVFNFFRENATIFRTQQIFSERIKYSKHDQNVREQCAIMLAEALRAREQHGPVMVCSEQESFQCKVVVACYEVNIKLLSLFI